MKKILLIEDDKFHLRVYQSKLQKAGYDVVIGENGKDIAYLIEKEKPDLLILDLIMPDSDGFEVLKALKKNNINIKVVVLSVLSQQEDRKKAEIYPIVEYLYKQSLTFKDVVGKVKEILN